MPLSGSFILLVSSPFHLMSYLLKDIALHHGV